MGRKNIRLTTLNIMKISPLIAKSIAAVLNDFEFSDDLLLFTKVFISNKYHGDSSLDI